MLLSVSPSMLEAIHLYTPAEPRLTPCHDHHHDGNDEDDDDVDDDDEEEEDVDDDNEEEEEEEEEDGDGDNLKNECRSADQNSTFLILLNPISLRRIYSYK